MAQNLSLSLLANLRRKYYVAARAPLRAGLTSVNLWECKQLITDGGIGDFKRQLPNCRLRSQRIQFCQ